MIELRCNVCWLQSSYRPDHHSRLCGGCHGELGPHHIPRDSPQHWPRLLRLLREGACDDHHRSWTCPPGISSLYCMWTCVICQRALTITQIYLGLSSCCTYRLVGINCISRSMKQIKSQWANWWHVNGNANCFSDVSRVTDNAVIRPSIIDVK